MIITSIAMKNRVNIKPKDSRIHVVEEENDNSFNLSVPMDLDGFPTKPTNSILFVSTSSKPNIV